MRFKTRTADILGMVKRHMGASVSRRVRQITYTLRRRGTVRTLKWLVRRVSYYPGLYLTSAGRRERRFDSMFGVETDGQVKLRELGISSPNVKHGVDYEATPREVFLDLIKMLNINYPEFTFIDLGAGKGRVLLMASHFPFKGIVGVEFSPELVRAAQENLGRYQNSNKKCHRIDMLCMDAADYGIPDEKAVIYLFNPFGDSVMGSVLNSIRLSLQAKPRELYVIYYNPVHAELFDRLACFEEIAWTGDAPVDASIYRYRLQRH